MARITVKAITKISRDTTANWNRYPTFVPEAGEAIVYSDWSSYLDDNDNNIYVPNLKIGDGITYLKDIPFVGSARDSGSGSGASSEELAQIWEVINRLGTLAYRNEVNVLYTPEGTISKPNVNVSLNTSTGYVAESATGGGAVTAGSAAACTLPQLTMSATGEHLNIGWASGSFTPNVPTAVTMPQFVSKQIASSVNTAELESAPTFTGTPAELVVGEPQL